MDLQCSLRRKIQVIQSGVSYGILTFINVVIIAFPAVSAKQETVATTNNVKTILTWNDYFDVKHFGALLGNASFKMCKISNCELWDRLDYEPDLPHHEYDAIIFHGIDTGKSSMTDLPLTRSPHQRYIFVLQESPVMRPHIYGFKDFFNWTATHRLDSDIHLTMVDIQKIHGERDNSKFRVWDKTNFQNMTHIPDFVHNKSKLLVWFVSNTDTQSKRDDYVDELSKHLAVDIYGWGRALACKSGDSKCDLMLNTIYKFYLAFENSLCDEYITEKFNRGLRHWVVPIVYGGADYKNYAPPFSYIDVRDFATPKELAKYLLYLDNNPEEYLKYFWWKKFYVQKGRVMWCDICEKLNDPKAPNRVYTDMESWWKSGGICMSPEEYYAAAFYRSLYMVYPDIEPWWK